MGISSLKLSDSNDVIEWCRKQTKNNGIDGVLITASTKSNSPIDTAAKVCRKRGRIVMIGVTGLNLSRDLFYEKELTFQVSCSYGPGRYDESYEKNNNDYPLGFVRWTENRNFQAILHSLENRTLITKPLISNKFPIQKAIQAYENLQNPKSLGILIQFDDLGTKTNKKLTKSIYFKKLENKKSDNLALSFIGAGNYASRILIPTFKKLSPFFNIISSNSGKGTTYLAKKFNFSEATSDLSRVFNDNKSNAIVIATRHDSHGELVIKALNSGKHVFVEKPLCLTPTDLEKIKFSLGENQILMIGYNRRFAKLSKSLKKQIDLIKVPKAFTYLCNAGFISENHWTQDPLKGGGRLIGEACHFIDLVTFLCGEEIKNITISKLGDNKSLPRYFFLKYFFQWRIFS